MNKENTNPKKLVEAAKPNPVASILAKASIVVRKELPVVLSGLAVMAIIAILTGIQWISPAFMVVLVLMTVARSAFQVGVVWQAMHRK